MIRSLCLEAESTLLPLHTGLKIFEHSNRNGICSFRLCQEGLVELEPFLHKRVIHVSATDWIKLLVNRTEVKGLETLSETFRVDLTCF